MDKKVIGILGGMGPLATADLFEKITLHTKAACDQDHPRVCIDSNTAIADRTAALLRGGALPVDLEILSKTTVGPTLGADSLQKSLIASVGSMVLIWMDIEILLSISKSLLSSSSLSFGDMMSRYFVAPNICPILYLPGKRNSKPCGAI